MSENTGCAWSPVFATASCAFVTLERRAQAPTRSVRKEGRIARHGDHQRARCMGEAALESRERPRESLDLVGDDAMAEVAVGCGIAVGVDRGARRPGARTRSITCATIGLPRKGCSPLSTPPMRLPWPPASTTPVRSALRGELMQRRPLGPLLDEGVERGRAVHGCDEKRERQVHLVLPVVVDRFEGHARAAARAELARRPG